MPAATSVIPLWDRVTEWRRRLAMIEDARSFLYLSTFYIEWDAYGRELLDALERAARRGVAVSLLVDGFGQRLGGVLMTPEVRLALDARLDALRALGADVRFYRPGHLVQRFVGGGQHIKIQAADTGEVITGSSNITKSSFEGWNEFSVAVRGPIARTVLESWPLAGGTVAHAHLEQLHGASGAPAEPDPPSGAGALDYWCCNPNLHQTWLGPFGWRGPNTVTDRMVAMLDAARATVAITAFYFKPAPVLMDAVLRAAGRGVLVEVFHSHRDALPATDLAWIAAAAGYRRLLEAGVTIHENRRGEHSKIVLVDDTWTAFGSYNFEDAAHDRLAEAMLATRESGVVAAVRTIIEGLRRDPETVVVTADWAQRLPWTVRGKMAVMRPFKRWM